MPSKSKIERKQENSLTELEAGDHIGMSAAWLRVQRNRGQGPAYLRMGRSVRYLRADLDAWVQRQRRVPGRAA